MKQIFFILIFTTLAIATELKTYNIYERDSRVDLMLAFDSPYTGEITQIDDGLKTILNLTSLYFPNKINESVESKLVKEFSIIPTSNTSIKIEINKTENLEIIASKTIDGYGLRIRAKMADDTTTQLSDEQIAANLGARAELNIDTNYYIVIAILIALLIILLYVKKRVVNKTQAPNNSWLFNKDDDGVKILFKKPIDTQNSIALVEFYENSYLIVTGNSNIMLDKFTNKKVKTEDDFQEVFEQNRKKLESYLDSGNTDRLKTYKDKVSQLGK